MDNLPAFDRFQGQRCHGCGMRWTYIRTPRVVVDQPGKRPLTVSIRETKVALVENTGTVDRVAALELSCGRCGHSEYVKRFGDS